MPCSKVARALSGSRPFGRSSVKSYEKAVRLIESGKYRRSLLPEDKKQKALAWLGRDLDVAPYRSVVRISD